ncbi:MAG: DNA polymerase I [Eubacteriales bacterium]|nr:DNA polymerase I [Eubacteriales bacterium]
MKRILLVDGYSMISRAFYGLPLLTNKDGVHINAILGFFKILIKAIDDEKIDHMIVCFDVKAPTFRHKIYPEYKGKRKPMPNELYEQVPYIKNLLKVMNINIEEKEGFEADDLIGTFAKNYKNESIEVVVLTGDRDLLQLVQNGITVRLMKTENRKSISISYSEATVKDEYGVNPIQLIDIKSLQGDTSDNIPGVKGVGEKQALELIKQFGSLENIFLHINEISKQNLKNKLIQQKDDAFLFKKLVTIDTKVPIFVPFDETIINDAYNEQAFNIIKKLELKSLYERFEKKGIDVSNNIFDTSKIKEVDDIYILENIIKDCKNKEYVGYYDNALCLSEDRIYKFNNIDIKKYLCGIKLVTYDLKSQLNLLYDLNLDIEDVAIMSYLNNPNLQNENFSNISLENINPYKAYYAFKMYNNEKSKLKSNNEIEIYENIEKPLIYVLYEMEKIGIKIDKNKLNIVKDDLEKEIIILKKDIYNLSNEEFNINSPKQLGNILFNKLHLETLKKNKTGFSTSVDVLEKLKDEHPIIEKILKYRTYQKLYSTYAIGLNDFIQEDNRIHSTFNQMVTATGRISSDSPNMQNIPVKTELGRKFRKVFIPEDGYIFIDADYSQVELRILASLSEDEKLIKAYNDSKDIHAITASSVFGIPLEKVTKEMRQNAKAVNFGIVYGISAFGLSEGLSITRNEAKNYIEQYFRTYPKVKEYLNFCVKEAKEKGFVKTFYGRIRPIPEILSSNHLTRSFGERIAMNSPIQGTAADIMKIAMININNSFKENNLKSHIVLQVHDEILVEAKIEEEEIVKNILLEKMKNASTLKVPLEVSIGIGNTWDDAH